MKKTFLILLILIFASCKTEKQDQFVGTWYVNKPMENNEILISKSGRDYIVQIGDKKLIGTKGDNSILIDNKGRIVKAIISDSGELIIDGETATRSNLVEINNDSSLFDSNSPNQVENTIDNQNTTNSTNRANFTEEEVSFGNATITGKNVLFRKSHTTNSNVLGKFSNGENVRIIDEYSPLNNNEAITKSSIKLHDSYGKTIYTLPKGKAVNIVSDHGGFYEVAFDHPKYGKLFAEIGDVDLDFISGDKWYKVERKNGKIGWVFSKFVSR